MDSEAITVVRTKSINYQIFMIVKRFFDLTCSLIGLIVLLPLMLIVKIAYLLHKDKNSIFYTQERIGLNGKVFKLYKFRTMVPNADELLKEVLKDPIRRREWNLTQKLQDDPRTTKVGRFLRKTSLDEIPQVINILKGEMAIIGPRPLVKDELDKHKGNHSLYESVKPGLTGWWAVNGRSDVEDYKNRLDLEYFYINNMSIKLDMIVVAKTFGVLINRNGAK